MAAPDSDYNLPGVSTTIADGGLKIAAPIPGRKLTIYGATTSDADDLPLHEPIAVKSVGLAVAGLKNADGTHSELSLAVEMAVAAGARNIEVVVIANTSEFATANARWDALATAFRATKTSPLDVVIPVGAYADETGLSGTDAYGDDRTDFRRQLQNFAFRATKDGNTVRGVVGIKPLLELANDENWTGAPTTTAEELFEIPTLAQVNEWIEHVNIENGTLHDHSSETELSGFLDGSNEESPGVVSSTYDGWAIDEDQTTAVDHLGNNVDGGRAVAVFGAVCRQVIPSAASLAAQNGYGGVRSINTNGAVAYAALLSTLRPEESPTNKTIPSILAPRTIPESFGRAFLNARIVTMVNRTLGFVVTKGITAAYNASRYTRSDYVMWTTYGITIEAVDLCKLAVEPYIGKQSSPAILNAMKVAIDSNLKSLQEIGAVQGIEAHIIQLSDDSVIGELDVELDIKVFGEISNINVRAALSRASQ